MYHYSAGHWTRVSAPAKAGYAAQLAGNLELVPGTRSVLSAANLLKSPGIPFGAIAKYGP